MIAENSLIIYVRSHSIVGVAYLDGTPCKLTFPNGDSTIGLYFYEDREGSCISYGLRYQSGYEDNLPRYHGNVLPLLWDKDNTYEYCGMSCEMRTILRDAGVWRDLCSAYRALDNRWSSKTPVPLYVSFHPELKDMDKLSFVKLLRETQEFELRSYGATIETLSIATFLQEKHIGRPKMSQYALFLQALSSDLYLSAIDISSEGGAVLKQEILRRRGRDYRKVALVEIIIESINRTTHLLNTENKKEREMVRLSHFHADEWIARLDNSRPGLPLKFEDISFVVAPHNKYSATIQPYQVEERTALTVEQVTHAIVRFARESLPMGASYSYILMLGDSCNNSNYRKNLSAELNIADKNVVVYTEAELAYRLPSYPSLNAEGLLPIEASIEENGKQEEIALKGLKKERIMQGAAHEDLSEGERMRLEREYQVAYDKGCGLLEEADYRGASDFFRIALEKKPGEKAAQSKLDEAGRLEAKEQIRQEQYDAFLQAAQTMEQKGDLEAALKNYRLALSVVPDSEYASKRLPEIKQKLKTEQDAQSFYDKARIFFEAKAFVSARVELEKVKLLLPPDALLLSGAKALLEQIAQEETKFKALADEIRTLRERYLAHKFETELEKAQISLKRLVEIDQDNTSHWLSELTVLEKAIRQDREYKEKTSHLLKKANTLAWEEDYTAAIPFVEEVLQMGESQEARELLARCRKKLDLQQENERRRLNRRLREQEASSLIDRIRLLISQEKTEEASDLVKKLAENFPERSSKARELRAKLFNLSASSIKKVGFSIESRDSSLSKGKGDFFGTTLAPPSKRESGKEELTENDFFDSMDQGRSLRDKSMCREKISNDDFNF